MRTIILTAIISCLVTGAAAADAQPAAEKRVYKPGNGVTAPVVVKQVKPRYTDEALRAKIEGTVTLECVVEADGRVGDVKVTTSLDEGLDREAVKAVRLWQFRPGKKDGKPVRVLISLELTFTLR